MKSEPVLLRGAPLALAQDDVVDRDGGLLDVPTAGLLVVRLLSNGVDVALRLARNDFLLGLLLGSLRSDLFLGRLLFGRDLLLRRGLYLCGNGLPFAAVAFAFFFEIGASSGGAVFFRSMSAFSIFAPFLRNQLPRLF
jgi:hypothetical protein